MGFMGLRVELRALRVAINELFVAIRQHEVTDTPQEAQKRNGAKPVPVVVNFDKKIIDDAKTQNQTQNRIQGGIRTWTRNAVIGAVIYSSVAALQWWEIRKATNAAENAANVATETLHFSYRPQVFVDSITGAGIEPGGDHRGEYRVAWDGTNYGNTVAHNVRVFAFYEFTNTRKSATKLPYHEVTDQEKVIPPTIKSGNAFFIRLNPTQKRDVVQGIFMTVSVRITYEGNFPGISYYAERCTSYKTTGLPDHSAIDNAPCDWAVENGWQEAKKAN